MIKSKVLTSLLIVSILLGTLIVWKTPGAAATYDYDLVTAINNGLDWLDRMSYREINSTYAVAVDTPSLSFRVKHSNGNWTISGKLTNGGVGGYGLPNSATMIQGGCIIQGTKDYGYILSYVPEGDLGDVYQYSCEACEYDWDFDGDGIYNDMKLYVEYVSINDTWTGMYGNISYINSAYSSSYLYLEISDQLAHPLTLNAYFVRFQQYGWEGDRYTIRPTTKGLADLYYNIRNDANFGSTARGINYTDRAKKLYRTWYGSGYTIDRFDGEYGTCALSRPFPEIAKYPGTSTPIPSDPDYIVEPAGGTLLNDYTPYYLGSPSDYSYWYNYSNAPFGQAYYWLQGRIARFVTVSRHVMPENEEWQKCPFQCDNTHFIYAYKSRTGFEWARNQYLANGFDWDLIQQQQKITPPVPGFDVVLGVGTDAKSIRACEDLYKYGKDVPYGLDRLKEVFIDSAQWDGYGIYQDLWMGIPMIQYPAYGTHNTATYGNALVQYYRVTGDDCYASKADQVIGVLLMLQNQPGQAIYSRGLDSEYYRAEFVGAFMPGYAVAYSFGQQNVYTTGMVDTIYGILNWAHVFQEDPQPMAYPCTGNSEVTIPSVWTLIEYYYYVNGINGHHPIVPTSPQFTLTSGTCTVYTDNGGSVGGDGTVEICNSNVICTSLGGNLKKYVGNIDRFRMTAFGGSTFGGGWSTLEYQWTFTLSQAVANWRTQLYFTVPDYIGYVEVGGNSLGVWVELYNSANKLVTSEKIIPYDGLNKASTFGDMFFYNNLTMLTSLSAGTYTIKLRFKADAGSCSYIFLGYKTGSLTGATALTGLPMGLESFGYTYDRAITPAPVTYHLNIQTSGLGSASPSGLQNYTEGILANITATPDSGQHFQYWIVNNTRLGIWQNYTMNPLKLYMDHDYNITAYFTAPAPPSPTQYRLTISCTVGGSTSPSGSALYNKGTIVTVSESPSSGYQFKSWTVNGTVIPFSSFNLNMTSDYVIFATFVPTTTVIFAITNPDGIHITSGVQIKVVNAPTYSLPLTLNQVYWITTIPAGTYVFRVSAPGYYNLDVPTTIPAQEQITIWIKLKPIVYLSSRAIEVTVKRLERYMMLQSKTMIFYAIIPYSPDYTEPYWIDPQHIIYVEPCFNKTATIKITVHYGTLYFPVVEIEAHNVAYVKFNITELYQLYAEESYKQKLDTNHWTGFCVQSDRHLLLEVTGFPYKPLQVFHCDTNGEATEIKNWNWINDENAILLDKFSTVSLTFGEAPNTIGTWIPVLGALMMVIVALGLIKRYVDI
jgi:hypothetical protein